MDLLTFYVCSDGQLRAHSSSLLHWFRPAASSPGAAPGGHVPVQIIGVIQAWSASVLDVDVGDTADVKVDT